MPKPRARFVTAPVAQPSSLQLATLPASLRGHIYTADRLGSRSELHVGRVRY